MGNDSVRRVGWAGVLVAVALLAAGCGTASSPDGDGGGGKYQNVAQDKIATDVFDADKVSLINYAKNKLTADCMAGKGFPQLDQAGVTRPPVTLANMDPTSDLGAPGDVATAARSGFGKDQAAKAAHVVSDDPSFDHALQTCQQSAADKIGPNVTTVEGQVFDVANQVTGDVDAARRDGPEADQLNGWIGT
jgi:hypothetical protein